MRMYKSPRASSLSLQTRHSRTINHQTIQFNPAQNSTYYFNSFQSIFHKTSFKMPFLSLIIPQIPTGSKDEFLAAWPTVAAAMKAQPSILGLSAGPIVAADGHAVTEFQFLQCLGNLLPLPPPRSRFIETKINPPQHSQHWRTTQPSPQATSCKATLQSMRPKLLAQQS